MSTRDDRTAELDLERLRRVEDKVARLEERGEATGDRQTEILDQLKDMRKQMADNNADIHEALRANRDEIKAAAETRHSELELRMNRAHEELEQRVGKVEEDVRPSTQARNKLWVQIVLLVLTAMAVLGGGFGYFLGDVKSDIKSVTTTTAAADREVEDQMHHQRTYSVYLRGEVRRVMDRLQIAPADEPPPVKAARRTTPR